MRRSSRLFAEIDHAPSSQAVHAERAMLDVLDGSCHTPIGAYATIDGGRGCIFAGWWRAPTARNASRPNVSAMPATLSPSAAMQARSCAIVAGPNC